MFTEFTGYDNSDKLHILLQIVIKSASLIDSKLS